MRYKPAYYAWRLTKLFLQPFIQILASVRCGLWGVSTDDKVRFLGIPRIRNLGAIKIGRGTRIISDSRNFVGSEVKTSFETGPNGSIDIGSNVGMSNCIIISQCRVAIGDEVFIGGGVKIYDNDFHSTDPDKRLNNPEIIPSAPIEIKSRAFIGGHSIILKGVTIGENAVIGAGSVVTKSVGNNEIWAGVPAKRIASVK